MNFTIVKRLSGNSLARAGVISTSHGNIETPAFIVVGTKATVKAVSPEAVKELGAEAVLANTYHLYLQPGSELVRQAGGLHAFMNWQGPTLTDSGGFQVFSLGASFGKGIGKILKPDSGHPMSRAKNLDIGCPRNSSLVKISENGVEFRSHIDGSIHFLTPEKSIQIQHNLGADIIFAFDECTSPVASYEYQKEALDRTHRWAERSLVEHRRLNLLTVRGSTSHSQALFGIVQGGRYQDLREQSARQISDLGFDGFGIGGSFDKDDMGRAVRWVNEILPEGKPRHLLGIGAVEDIFLGIENGVDTFDCVSPTREARNGRLYTKAGPINITNSVYRDDLTAIESDCLCTTCQKYTRAYLAHLFRAHELFAYTLASVHNLYFFVHLVKNIRQSILDDTFFDYKEHFLRQYIRQ